MAYTGTGTQTDPFVVNNYDELKEVSLINQGNKYIKLGSDIDCNEYGKAWEWETIKFNANATDLDLDGHTIKNVMIKSGNVLFYYPTNSYICKIHNGKILNVFNDGATNVFYSSMASTSTPSTLYLENLTMSINGSNLTGAAFYNVFLENCSIYFKSNRLKEHAILFGNQYYYMKNCDLWFDISNLNTKSIIYCNSSSGITVSNSRIRGKVKGTPYYYSGNYYICCNTIKSFSNVIELDTTETITGDYNLKGVFYTLENTLSIINKEIMNSTYTDTGDYNCTTEQIRNPEYLNSIGFDVAEVV